MNQLNIVYDYRIGLELKKLTRVLEHRRDGYRVRFSG